MTAWESVGPCPVGIETFADEEAGIFGAFLRRLEDKPPMPTRTREDEDGIVL